jgi:phytoene dehydrogenase-like protein
MINNQKNEEFDAIVIGAGLGGLGAATQLSLDGKKVLLIEKHSTPGGFATSFVRGRFEFEGALHELSGYGSDENPRALHRFFHQLGIVPDKMNFLQVPELYSCKFYDGERYDLPFGLDNVINYLCKRFPNDVKDIKKFFKVTLNIYEGLGKTNKPLQILMKHRWLIRVLGLDISEFVGRFFKNKRLQNVVSQYWAYLGGKPETGNAVLFAGCLMTYILNGAAYPNKRSHNMSILLADYVKSKGGVVKYNALVNKILVEDGKLVGVEMLNGQKYYAKGVISNVNPRCVITKMLPKDTLPASYVRKVNAPDIGPSIFSVYLGLNKSPEELGLDSYETFINTTDEVDDEAIENGINKTKFAAVIIYNLVQPDISPKGTTMCVISALQYGRDWINVPPAEYHRIKDKVGAELVALFEKYMCPEVYEHIEVCEVATPYTYYRYSKSLEGSIYGSDNSVFNSPVFKLSQKTPLSGLYFAGCWTGEGGGYDPALNSGRKAAKYLLKELNAAEGGN